MAGTAQSPEELKYTSHVIFSEMDWARFGSPSTRITKSGGMHGSGCSVSGFQWAEGSQQGTTVLRVYFEGQGDLVSGLIMGITRLL